jgi:O-antigen/teichoic acid export membrane protein
LRLSCLFLPFITLNSMFTAAIKGFNRMTLMVAADRFAKSSAKLILLILFALLGLNVTRAISAFGIAEVTAVVLALYFINRIFPLRRSLENSTREIRKLFVFSLPVYLSNTIQMFSYNIQTLLLGSLNSIFNVGIFSLATQINMIGSLFHSSIIGASMPVVSTLYDQQKIKALNRYYQATSRWTFTLNLPLFLIIVSYPETILRVFGQSFTQGVSALTILAWANLVNTGTGTCGVVLDMTGHTKLKLINSIITVVLTVALNLLLIPSLGLVGGAIASLVSVSVTNVLRIGEIFAHLKILPYNANFLKSIAAGVFAWLTSLALRSTIIPGIDLLSMAFNAVVLSLVFGVTIYLLGLSHEEWVILAELQQWLGRKFSRDQKGDRS